MSSPQKRKRQDATVESQPKSKSSHVNEPSTTEALLMTLVMSFTNAITDVSKEAKLTRKTLQQVVAAQTQINEALLNVARLAMDRQGVVAATSSPQPPPRTRPPMVLSWLSCLFDFLYSPQCEFCLAVPVYISDKLGIAMDLKTTTVLMFVLAQTRTGHSDFVEDFKLVKSLEHYCKRINEELGLRSLLLTHARSSPKYIAALKAAIAHAPWSRVHVHWKNSELLCVDARGCRTLITQTFKPFPKLPLASEAITLAMHNVSKEYGDPAAFMRNINSLPDVLVGPSPVHNITVKTTMLSLLKQPTKQSINAYFQSHTPVASPTHKEVITVSEELSEPEEL